MINRLAFDRKEGFAINEDRKSSTFLKWPDWKIENFSNDSIGEWSCRTDPLKFLMCSLRTYAPQVQEPDRKRTAFLCFNAWFKKIPDNATAHAPSAIDGPEISFGHVSKTNVSNGPPIQIVDNPQEQMFQLAQFGGTAADRADFDEYLADWAGSPKAHNEGRWYRELSGDYLEKLGSIGDSEEEGGMLAFLEPGYIVLGDQWRGRFERGRLILIYRMMFRREKGLHSDGDYYWETFVFYGKLVEDSTGVSFYSTKEFQKKLY